MTKDDEAVLGWLVQRAIASGTHPDVLQVYSGGSKPASYLRITIPDGESTREKSKKTNQNRRTQISRFLELTSGGDLPGALANYGRSGKAKSAGFVAECKKKLNLDSLKVALGPGPGPFLQQNGRTQPPAQEGKCADRSGLQKDAGREKNTARRHGYKR